MSLLRNTDNPRVITAKKRMAEILCSEPIGALINRWTGGVVPAYGLRVETRSPVVSNTVRARLFWRLYEGAEVRMVRAHMRPTPCIIDLGTSLGVLGAVACRTVPGGARVIGVEANPDLLRVARQNLSCNAPDSPYADVTVAHGAIDYSRPPGASVAFDASGIHVGAALAAAGGTRTFSAPVVRLGSLLAQNGVYTYTLLMDIEGAESGVLLDEPEALDQCQQMIVEFHDTDYDGQQLIPQRPAPDSRQLRVYNQSNLRKRPRP